MPTFNLYLYGDLIAENLAADEFECLATPYGNRLIYDGKVYGVNGWDRFGDQRWMAGLFGPMPETPMKARQAHIENGGGCPVCKNTWRDDRLQHRCDCAHMADLIASMAWLSDHR